MKELSEEEFNRLKAYVEERRLQDKERRDRWLAWIGPLTGLIGALAALLAVILR